MLENVLHNLEAFLVVLIANQLFLLSNILEYIFCLPSYLIVAKLIYFFGNTIRKVQNQHKNLSTRLKTVVMLGFNRSLLFSFFLSYSKYITIHNITFFSKSSKFFFTSLAMKFNARLWTTSTKDNISFLRFF